MALSARTKKLLHAELARLRGNSIMARNRNRKYTKSIKQIPSAFDADLLRCALNLLELAETDCNYATWQFILDRMSTQDRVKLISRLLEFHRRKVENKKNKTDTRTEEWELDSYRPKIQSLEDDCVSELDDAARTIHLRLSTIFPDGYQFLVTESRKKLLELLKATKTCPPPNDLDVFQRFEARLDEMQKAFKLSVTEKKIVRGFFLFRFKPQFRDIFTGRFYEAADPPRRLEVIRTTLGLSKKTAHTCFTAESTLFTAEIVVSQDYRNGELTLQSAIYDYLAGFTKTMLLQGLIQEQTDLDNGLNPEDFLVPRKNFDLMELLLKASSTKGLNLLLHGAPGTGKTESTLTLARNLGYKIYFVRLPKKEDSESFSVRSILLAAQNLLRGKKSILVVDECDEILNTQRESKRKVYSDPKAWLNTYLDASKLKIIWITNHVHDIDYSHIRRFSYIQVFTAPQASQRLKAWKIQVDRQKIKLLTPAQLEELAQQYEVSPGVIAQALKDIRRMRSGTAEAFEQLKNILSQQQRYLSGTDSIAVPKNAPGYDIDGLNTDTCLSTLRGNVENFLKLQEAPSQPLPFPNLNILLFGPPGTGKTEFARNMANTLKTELIVKRASDLISMYVGGTEKNIARAFQEAQERKAILFLDEADSFFIRRESAVRSWEVSQTNEILTQMERFSGVLICATNFEKNLDPAAIRRFSHKVKFQALKPEANLKFFERVLLPLTREPFGPDHKRRIEAIQGLVPGDFRVVYQKHWLSKDILLNQLISDLENEARLRASFGEKVIRPLGSN